MVVSISEIYVVVSFENLNVSQLFVDLSERLVLDHDVIWPAEVVFKRDVKCYRDVNQIKICQIVYWLLLSKNLKVFLRAKVKGTKLLLLIDSKHMRCQMI